MNRILPHLALVTLGALGAFTAAPSLLLAAPAEGVALAIVFDTSGSMQQAVKDSDGTKSPKYVIAKRALQAVLHRLQHVATNAPGGEVRKIEAGLFAFRGNGAIELVRFGPFDGRSLARWTNNLPPPTAGTPLGNALETATQAVLKSPQPRKHVLIITDGQNTVGPKPETVLPGLKQQASRRQAAFSVHCVAFDVAAKVFEPIQKLGATVVGAASETQLNDQLTFILEKKILLEDEEPAPPKKAN